MPCIYSRDDTLVCTLQSNSAREFLERHREALLKDSGRLLVRMIHLMRVACKAVLALLDYLIEAGSSASYRMRDDFVTPLNTTVGVHSTVD